MSTSRCTRSHRLTDEDVRWLNMGAVDRVFELDPITRLDDGRLLVRLDLDECVSPARNHDPRVIAAAERAISLLNADWATNR